MGETTAWERTKHLKLSVEVNPPGRGSAGRGKNGRGSRCLLAPLNFPITFYRKLYKTTFEAHTKRNHV